jgi:hypothetical protein
MTAAGLGAMTGKAMRLLLSGELGAREASAFAQLCNSMCRIIPTIDLETRLATLERQIADEPHAAPEETGISPDSNSTGAITDNSELASETYGSAEAEQTPSSVEPAVEGSEETDTVIDEPSEGEEEQ